MNIQNFSVDRSTESVTARARGDTNSASDEHSEFFDRPVTESVMSRTGSDTDFPRDVHSEFFGRPVTESVMARAGSDTDLSSEEHSESCGRPVDNVMIKNNDFTDSRYHQRCADNGLRLLAHALVRGKPIREKGRFRYLYSPVHDADWSAEYSVGVIPVGAIRIGYLRDPVDRSQSTDAAPLTELLIFYTLLHLLGVGLSAIQCGITFVWRNLHGVAVIFQCVRQ